MNKVKLWDAFEVTAIGISILITFAAVLFGVNAFSEIIRGDGDRTEIVRS